MSGPVVNYPPCQNLSFQPLPIPDDHYIITVTFDGWVNVPGSRHIDIISVWRLKSGGPGFWFDGMPAGDGYEDLRQILLSPDDNAETAAAKLEDMIRCMDFGGMCARVGGSVCWGGATNVRAWLNEKQAERQPPLPANALRF